MSPDMKRLVDAVRAIELDDELEHRTDSTGTGDKFGDVCGSEFVETIVRAVLTELLLATEDRHDCDRYYAGFSKYIQETINHVLNDAPSPETQSTVKAG